MILWNDIDERATVIAEYVLATGATVRATAERFGISKSTVHTVVTITNALCGWSGKPKA